MTDVSIQSALAGDNTPATPDLVVQAPQDITPADTQTGGPSEAAKPDVTPTPEKPKEKSDVDKAFDAMRKQIRELKRQVTVANQPKQEAQTLDPITDLDGYNKAIGQQITQAQLQTRIALSEEITSEKYPDYDDMRDAFMEMAEANPAIVNEMFNAKNPAEFAYKYAKEAKARAEIGDPIQYGEKIRKETTDKLMASIDQMVEAKLKERLSGILPTSLAGEQTQGSRITNPTGFNGPTPLGDILKSK